MLSNSQKIILAFITVIIGLVFISQVVTIDDTVTTKGVDTISLDLVTIGVKNATGIINTSVKYYPTNYLAATSGWRSYDSGCQPAGLAFTAVNGTGVALTNTADWTKNTAGGYITFNNSYKINGTLGSNTTTLTLEYCRDGYIVESWQRSMLNMLPGFFALAILFVGVGFFYSIAKDIGII